MEAVFDINKGPLAKYAEALAILIEHYEENRYPVKNADGIKNLKFLMDQNNLKQKDLEPPFPPHFPHQQRVQSILVVYLSGKVFLYSFFNKFRIK